MSLASSISACAVNNKYASSERRHWLASLELEYQNRKKRSALVHMKHEGPLRVQRPFYPENDGCCHTYILHPPGGMALGDEMNLAAHLSAGTKVLMTTPSAGKMYGMFRAEEKARVPQSQASDIFLGADAQCEWLPQETIVFNGAMAHIRTRFHLEDKSANFFVWDIVRLGRAASGESFNEGYCKQHLEIWLKKMPLFIERISIDADSSFMNAKAGLQGKNTLATAVGSYLSNRDQRLEWSEALSDMSRDNGSQWALTQINDLLIVRYLGSSILDCRRGLEYMWRALRPKIHNKTAVSPRIWNT